MEALNVSNSVEDDYDEDYSDSDDGIMTAALPVPDGEVTDLNCALTSGDDYLRYVRYEASQCAQTVTANRDSIPVTKKNVSVPVFGGNNSHINDDSSGFTTPSGKWQEWQIAAFSDVRLKFRRMRSSKSCPVFSEKLPLLADEDTWIRYCLGDELQDNDSGHPPTTSLIASLKQPLVCTLLTYFQECVYENNIGHSIALWIYALLVALEKPIDPDTCYAIREICRRCCSMRLLLKPESNDELMNSLNMLVCIISRYFDQKDLADQIS